MPQAEQDTTARCQQGAVCEPQSDGCCTDLAQFIPPKLFKSLCDPTRVALLTELARATRPLSVGEIGTCCPIDLSVVSRHLAILREANVVSSERRGKHVYYWMNSGEVTKALRELADAIESCCPPNQDK